MGFLARFIMKIRKLTKSQKNKVDKIDALLTQLRVDGVYPYIEYGAGGAGLTFIRSDDEDRTEIGDVIICPPTNYELYEEIKDKEYQAYDADFNNPIDVLGV